MCELLFSNQGQSHAARNAVPDDSHCNLVQNLAFGEAYYHRHLCVEHKLSDLLLLLYPCHKGLTQRLQGVSYATHSGTLCAGVVLS